MTGDRLAPRGGPLGRSASWALSVAALLVAVLAGVHLSATFLHLAPRNHVSQRQAERLNWWLQPWFDQNWAVFAPEPGPVQVTDLRLEARTAKGARTDAWIDLTAADYAAIRGSLLPARLPQNELRTAFSQYQQAREVPATREYLLDVVVARLEREGRHDFDRVQLRATYTDIPGPGKVAVAPRVAEEEWWAVADG
ncbi:DUF5819 family protein [Streptomyces boninensis]|uniref:DUF5819 family protein n=1 Tax=Streptomyces boninensis TaxID=2039455 RepID=UPI003B21E102